MRDLPGWEDEGRTYCSGQKKVKTETIYYSPQGRRAFLAGILMSSQIHSLDWD
jgi:hypothetical protein